jgi:ABC-type polysaccharide/polyol phosphate transport system ATPase subunit
MEDNIAISIKNISKKYCLQQPIKDADGNETHELWALKDISFDIKKGESVGIIGSNGSGKSTLLKILAGVTKPTTGSAEIKGKVASILDIGAGFHPELSGRENVFLNGQIYGFSHREIKQKYNEIVAFSGIGKFIDEPVKNYSNGMYLRLAFSIMAHLDFDVYLFDEVFSVGDAEFSMKAREKFHRLLNSEKTILFVSHNLNELAEQDKYILLENGVLKENTREKLLLSKYLEDVLNSKKIDIHTQSVIIDDFSEYNSSNAIILSKVSLYQENNSSHFDSSYGFTISVSFEKLDIHNTADIIVSIIDAQGHVILSSSPLIGNNCKQIEEAGTYIYNCHIPANFFSNRLYRLSISFFVNAKDVISSIHSPIEAEQKNDVMKSMIRFENLITFKASLNNSAIGSNFDIVNLNGGLLPEFKWTLSKPV